MYDIGALCGPITTRARWNSSITSYAQRAQSNIADFPSRSQKISLNLRHAEHVNDEMLQCVHKTRNHSFLLKADEVSARRCMYDTSGEIYEK